VKAILLSKTGYILKTIKNIGNSAPMTFVIDVPTRAKEFDYLNPVTPADFIASNRLFFELMEIVDEVALYRFKD